MNIQRKQIGLVAMILSLISGATAADLSGVWKAEFDTQIGVQKYTFTLKQEGVKVTGMAASDIGGEKEEVELKEGKVEGDTVTFVENLSFDGNDLRIEYKGKLIGEEIKFTRQVADVATEQLVAKRVKNDDASAERSARQASRRRRPPIELGADDKPVFPAAPAGFDEERESIAKGKIEVVDYDSKIVGIKRKMVIYTPPGYSAELKYPVLYLLHGIGDDEMTWWRQGKADVILDNLYAEKKLAPMIVVMPNGRADKNMTPRTPWGEQAPAFAAFEKELLEDIIPFVEGHYSVKGDSEHRALAGLSMGGGQSLNFGLKHLATFAWVGGFSSAPNTKPPAELVPDPAMAREKLKLLWVSCGDKDGLINISQGVHAYLREHNVPHIWHVDSGGHTRGVWSNDLYLLAQRIFR